MPEIPTETPDVAVLPALREPANQVSPKAPWLWAAGSLIPSALLVAGLIAAERFGFLDVPVWAWVLLVGADLAYAVAMPIVRYRVHRWESTETAVYTQTGWLSRERRIAPMSRVQTVDYQQTAVGRLLGLASVTVTTASAAGPLRIQGIAKDVADKLVEDLTHRAEAEHGDAT